MRLLAGLVTLLVLQWAAATTYHERTPEEMVLAADMIFVGTVDALRNTGTAELPWTEVTFRELEWLAQDGQPVDREHPDADLPAVVALELLGGSASGGERVTVSGLPQFRQGQRVLVFAYADSGLASPIVGVRQGVFTLDASGARDHTGAYLAVPAPGRLMRDGRGAGMEEVLSSIAALLEAGEVPEPMPVEEAGASGSSPAPTTADSRSASAEVEEERLDAPAPESQDAPPAEAVPEGADAGGAEAEDPETATSETETPEGDQEPATTAAPATVVSYVVDESGGPLLLSAAVMAAAQAWQDAAPEAVLFVDADTAEGSEAAAAATHRLAYGEPGLFGPDAVSFTLLRSSDPATEVLLSPSAGAALTPALLHELGVLMGLPEAGDGVMAATMLPGATAPTPADLEALRALRVYRPEDLNRDGVVDFYDLAVLAEAYGTQGVNMAADLDGDGVVGEADLELLRQAYQFLPPSENPPN